MNRVKKDNPFGFLSMLDDILQNDPLEVWNPQRPNSPAANIKETEDNFTLEMAAPGRAKEDFNIAIEDNVLTISSERKHAKETKDEKEQYTRREFRFTSFSRSFTLPEEVKQEEITAAYTDGVLTISVPKDTEAKLAQKRTIAIS